MKSVRRAYATENESSLESAKEQGEAAKESITETAESAADSAKDAAKSAESSAEGFVEEAKSSISASVDSVRDALGDAAETVAPSFASKLRPARPEPEEGPNLFIGNLYFEVTDDALREEMEHFGTVKAVKIIRDPRGLSKGCVSISSSCPLLASHEHLESNIANARLNI